MTAPCDVRWGYHDEEHLCCIDQQEEPHTESHECECGSIHLVRVPLSFRPLGAPEPAGGDREASAADTVTPKPEESAL